LPTDATAGVRPVVPAEKVSTRCTEVEVIDNRIPLIEPSQDTIVVPLGSVTFDPPAAEAIVIAKAPVALFVTVH